MPVPHRDHRTVVIGAGQAGFALCAKLRELGVSGPITLIGKEDHAPYQRPPLSKSYLLGKMERERLFFRPETFYAEQNITLQLGCPVSAIERQAKTVTTAEGTSHGYDTLVLATGATPVRLPDAMGGGLTRVHYIRSLADVDAMARNVATGKHALIIGGGYIGLEAAAITAELGMHVTLIEAADRILARIAARETSSFFRDLHTEHGVDIREGTMLERLIGQTGVVTGADLSDDSHLDVDVAIVGIGVRPNVDLAVAAELDIDNGIKVDAQCRTSDPDIFAIGDCASFPHDGARVRLESVGNAIDQAQSAAEVIAGNSNHYTAKPWFWSDQYDVKLQIVGLSTGYDRVVKRVERDKRVSFWYYAGEQLLAVDAMNNPRAYVIAKRLIDAGKTADASVVTNANGDLKSLLG